MEVQISIKVAENVFVLNMQEARELYNTLHSLFGTVNPWSLPPYVPGTRSEPFKYGPATASISTNHQGD